MCIYEEGRDVEPIFLNGHTTGEHISDRRSANWPIRVGVCRRENARLEPVYEQAVKSGKADYDFACKAARESSALSVSAVVFEGRNKNFRAVTSDLLRLALSRDRNKLPQLRDAKPCQHEDDD